MKIYELIEFTERHTELKKVCLRSLDDSDSFIFFGTVKEILEMHIYYLNLNVADALYNPSQAILNIFYNPEDLHFFKEIK